MSLASDKMEQLEAFPYGKKEMDQSLAVSYIDNHHIGIKLLLVNFIKNHIWNRESIITIIPH